MVELPLASRLLRSSRLPGFHGIAAPTIICDAGVWASDSGMFGDEGQREARRITRLGLAGGVRENLVDQDPIVAEVVSLTSAAATRPARALSLQINTREHGTGQLLRRATALDPRR